MTSTPMPPPDPRNVQGMILRGYTHPYSCHMLFTFAAKPGAAGLIGALLPYVQSAQDWGDAKPARMLNISLTYNGILTFEPDLAGQFPNAFELRPWSQGGQTSVGGTGPSEPSPWWARPAKQPPHCLLPTFG